VASLVGHRSVSRLLGGAHAYRGVFGSHIAHLLRRVRRVADMYDANPIFHRGLGSNRQSDRARGEPWSGPRLS